ncbi:WD40-repeat-containing domain protein [Cantharellus anzutake]|uniref:WD40-repeat-containing domain protein n=1 Tax=Cantharellus anzutake TaxID=1750568 RepID=UPI0019056B92|nr:WD40-repeat-containing domain protein [Cantharellus anzutake]KAF8332818.1 WD40-repeat-containing domain protein [Cantharellus anzutake]
MGGTVDTLYISASANRYPNAASTNRSSPLVAFGTHKFIAIWDVSEPFNRGISRTLAGHEAEVTCTHWIEHGKLLCSADLAGSIRLWERSNNDWTTKAKIRGHEMTINAISSYRDILISGSSDATIKVWQLQSNSLEHLQTIDMKGRYPFSIVVSELPDSPSLILAVGSTDRLIQIYSRSGQKFVHSLSLAGHEDWVKGLSFYMSSGTQNTNEGSSLTLASASQDGYVRLWLIKAHQSFVRSEVDDLLDAFEKRLGEVSGDAEEGGKTITNRAHVLTVTEGGSTRRQFSLTFDALLIGHEAGVTSVSWCSVPGKPPALLSTSADSSVMIWSPSSPPTVPQGEPDCLWTIHHRFGDVGGVKAGGFVGGLWAQGGKEVVAWGWNGGWRRWSREEGANETWREIGAVTGHQGPVRGLAWDPEGNYLLSASLDQTTRIHGHWIRNDGETRVETWHEIARPQIHGYDLISAIFIDPLRFVSAADEKVARVFDAPKAFIQALAGIQATQINTDMGSRPSGASVPPLGLSNKATEPSDDADSVVAAGINPDMFTRMPFEPELSAVTLWPEIEKLFGHGYELISIASSHSGSLLATACKSSTAEHAVVRLHDTGTWRLFGQPLAGHTLTITRISFSPDDRYILTVSRDRTWCLFERQLNGEYAPCCHEKPHSRIIWDCAWSHEGDIFATAARDKLIKIWKQDEASKKWTVIQTLKGKEGATAVDFAPSDRSKRRRMAVGFENGEVAVYVSPLNAASKWEVELTLDASIAHADQVHRLGWRPGGTDPGENLDLAVCSEDRSLRIFRFVFQP